MENLKNLKKGNKILVECTVEAVFPKAGLVMVTTRDCDEGFDAYIDEIKESKEDKQMEKIKIKKLNENAKIPTRGSNYAAGYDLYACTDRPITISPHSTEKIHTGFAIEIPHGYFGAIFARSGLATKEGLRPANCVGVCDSDYRGEYIVAIHNDTDLPAVIEPNERIAQLVVMPFLEVLFKEVDELSDTNRGTGGFGSTGKV